jgi:hypothetical protein
MTATSPARDKGKLLRVIAFLGLALLPAALLFDLRANFFYDWHNHQWLVGYFGEYSRQHWTIPESITGVEAIGMPHPVFYGFVLYPALGVLSAALGAGLALRVAIGLTFAVQFAAAYLAGRQMLRSRWLAVAVAASTSWSTYSLTNLYNRAALPEFFAVAFLSSAACFGMLAIMDPPRRLGTPFAWLSGGFAILTAGSHPPTALIAFGFVLLLAATLLGCRLGGRWPRQTDARAWLFVGLTGALIVAPWIYANVQLQSALGIVGKFPTFSFTPDGCDSLLARFAPFPYDPISVEIGKTGEGTPYIEAPVITGYLVVLAWAATVWLRTRMQARTASVDEVVAKWVICCGIVWFALTLTLSLSPAVAAKFRFLAPYIQFATRFVSHANIGLMVTVLGAGFVFLRKSHGERFAREATAVGAAVLAVAAIGVLIKLTHGAVVMVRANEPQYAWRGERRPLIDPGKPDAAGDYALLRRFPQLRPGVVNEAEHVRFSVGVEGRDFARVGSTTVSLDRVRWVITNVVAFPWNRVTVNGRDIAEYEMAAHQYRVAVKLPAGQHTFEYAWLPDRIWSAFRAGSLVSCAVLLAALGWALGRVGLTYWNGPATLE